MGMGLLIQQSYGIQRQKVDVSFLPLLSLDMSMFSLAEQYAEEVVVLYCKHVKH